MNYRDKHFTKKKGHTPQCQESRKSCQSVLEVSRQSLRLKRIAMKSCQHVTHIQSTTRNMERFLTPRFTSFRDQLACQPNSNKCASGTLDGLLPHFALLHFALFALYMGCYCTLHFCTLHFLHSRWAVTALLHFCTLHFLHS